MFNTCAKSLKWLFWTKRLVVLVTPVPCSRCSQLVVLNASLLAVASVEGHVTSSLHLLTLTLSTLSMLVSRCIHTMISEGAPCSAERPCRRSNLKDASMGSLSCRLCRSILQVICSDMCSRGDASCEFRRAGNEPLNPRSMCSR